jgi:hypothetical protein
LRSVCAPAAVTVKAAQSQEGIIICVGSRTSWCADSWSGDAFADREVRDPELPVNLR